MTGHYMQKLRCSRCGKGLWKKYARMIDGKVLCGNCLFGRDSGSGRNGGDGLPTPGEAPQSGPRKRHRPPYFLKEISMTEVKVTQEDRDAAADWYGTLYSPEGILKMRTGRKDSNSLVQAFARHREAAEQGLWESVLEEAAKVARTIAERSEPHKASGAFEAAHAIEALAAWNTRSPTIQLDGGLVERLRARYTADVPPPCPVCGGELSIAQAGGGQATIWACSPYESDPDNPGHNRPKEGRSLGDDGGHYSRSRWTQYRSGDQDVLDLLDALTHAPITGAPHAGEAGYLTAYVSLDGKIVGIDHETEADWHEVRRAHEVLRDRLNERLAAQEQCPVKPAPITGDMPTSEEDD